MLQEYRFEDIYVRHAIDDEPEDSPFTMHIHEQCEIYFFLSGEVEYLVEGSRYPLEENNLMIMRPAEVHKPRILSSKRYERYAVNFPLSFVTAMDPEGRLLRAFLDRPLGTNNRVPEPAMDSDLISKLFAGMFRDQLDDYDRLRVIRTSLLMLLEMIYRSYRLQGKVPRKPRSTAERIVSYVNNHLFEDLTVPQLAEHFFVSPAHFNRIFRQATGASPWEYITKKRLTAAKEKIRSGSSALEAAESCGFHDYSSFYRAYTKHFGCAPTNL